jgi:tRNA(Arg) A34 adenosine deaminase TadA
MTWYPHKVTCVLKHHGKVVVKTTTQTIAQFDPSAHAEITAVRQVLAEHGPELLTQLTCETDLEPCVMCAGVLGTVGIKSVHYRKPDLTSGGCRTIFPRIKLAPHPTRVFGPKGSRANWRLAIEARRRDIPTRADWLTWTLAKRMTVGSSAHKALVGVTANLCSYYLHGHMRLAVPIARSWSDRAWSNVQEEGRHASIASTLDVAEVWMKNRGTRTTWINEAAACLAMAPTYPMAVNWALRALGWAVWCRAPKDRLPWHAESAKLIAKVMAPWN